MPPFDLLHQLRHLDHSSPEFSDRLTSLFNEEGYKNCVRSLQENDSTWLMEYLDNALNILRPASPAFRKCLRELRALCGSRNLLPQSSMLPGSPPNTAKWPIASRGSCDVYEGFINDSKVCVKRLRIYSCDGEEKAKHDFCKEVVVWKCLEHPNIVPLLGITVTPLQLISVWMAGGELSEYVNTHSCADRLGLISDVADGLNYLHTHSVIHGDLKGPSILVDNAGHARLTDFGLAAVTPDLGSAGSIKDGHAVRWAAPEILEREQPVSKESDIYSFAMVVVEAFTGKPPFYGIPPTPVAVGILLGNRPARPTHPCLANDLWEMTERCWNQDPQHRPEISEVVLCLRAVISVSGHSDANDSQAPDSMTLRSVQQRELSRGLCLRPSCWTPISRIAGGLRWLRGVSPVSQATSDAEPAQGAKSGEDENPTYGRHEPFGASNILRSERVWFPRCRAARRPHAARQRSKTKVTRNSVPPVSSPAEKHFESFKRSLIQWTRVRGVNRQNALIANNFLSAMFHFALIRETGTPSDNVRFLHEMNRFGNR